MMYVTIYFRAEGFSSYIKSIMIHLSESMSFVQNIFDGNIWYDLNLIFKIISIFLTM